jgi:5,10-methylenetetrahydrofolate reductase
LGKTSNDNILILAEKLQRAFIKPWENLTPNNELDINLMDQLLRNTAPPLPSIGQVKNSLKHLNPRKATGVGKIPAWILKRFSDDLAPVVHNIVTASIKQCKYPSQYKHALILTTQPQLLITQAMLTLDN